MRLLTREQLAAEKGIVFSRQHLYRLIQKGKFPPPIKPGGTIGSRNQWSEAEIDKWLRKRAAARFAEEGEAA